MQNKLLKAIFPDRATAVSNNESRFPISGSESGSSSESAAISGAADVVSQAFSQLVASGTAGVNSSSNAGTGSAFGDIAHSANGNGTNSELPELFGDVSKNLDRLRTITETQVTEIGANTSALSTNTAAKSASQTLASVGKAASGLLGGFSALPLISGIFSLFGGGSDDSQKQPALPKYAAPPAINFDEAIQSGSSGAETQSAAYDMFGKARAGAQEVAPVPDYSSLIAITQTGAVSNPNGSVNTAPSGADDINAAAVAATKTNATNVTVNIQAMDSQSFLDRSHDIAQAVREAMLNMHSINDVVNDL